MDRNSFEESLKREGYDEISTKTTPGDKHNPEHNHPYDVRAMVIDGALTLSWSGQTKTYVSGDIFTMARGCPHTETFGTRGATTLSGRKR
jgi:quercetin dioxygenase-like cupin family protein